MSRIKNPIDNSSILELELTKLMCGKGATYSRLFHLPHEELFEVRVPKKSVAAVKKHLDLRCSGRLTCIVMPLSWWKALTLNKVQEVYR